MIQSAAVARHFSFQAAVDGYNVYLTPYICHARHGKHALTFFGRGRMLLKAVNILTSDGPVS